MGAGRPGLGGGGRTGTIVPRSALRGRWRGEGSRPSGLVEAPPPAWPARSAATSRPRRRGAAGAEVPRPGEEPAACAARLARPRGGMAGLGGSGWEEAVGEGRSTSGRASEQAGGGHLDIDPLPRYEMAHWPRHGRRLLTPPGRAWDRRERRRGGRGRKMPQMASRLGRAVLFRWGAAAGAYPGLRAASVTTNPCGCLAGFSQRSCRGCVTEKKLAALRCFLTRYVRSRIRNERAYSVLWSKY